MPRGYPIRESEGNWRERRPSLLGYPLPWKRERRVMTLKKIKKKEKKLLQVEETNNNVSAQYAEEIDKIDERPYVDRGVPIHPRAGRTWINWPAVRPIPVFLAENHYEYEELYPRGSTELLADALVNKPRKWARVCLDMRTSEELESRGQEVENFIKAVEEFSKRKEEKLEVSARYGLYNPLCYAAYIEKAVDDRSLLVSSLKGHLRAVQPREGTEPSFFLVPGSLVFCLDTEYALVKDGKLVRVQMKDTSFSAPASVAPLGHYPLRVATEEEKELLVERGRRYLELAARPAQARASRGLVRGPGGLPVEIEVRGLFMVDEEGAREHGSEAELICEDTRWKTPAQAGEEMLACLPPYINGYSLNHNRWCAVWLDELVLAPPGGAGLYQRLILPGAHKNNITRLAACYDLRDHVGDKGKAAVFLLTGAPGTGKTMTAETVADCLARPLFRVSVGALGTTAETVEKMLKVVLKLAERWNAILLFDEADVFIEERDYSNLERNAITCILLQLLEQHVGVLFMTSNRSDRIDRAILSRVTYRMHLPELTKEDRGEILVGLAGLHYGDLSPYEVAGLRALARRWDVDGREMRNDVAVMASLAGQWQEGASDPVNGPVHEALEKVFARQGRKKIAAGASSWLPWRRGGA